MPRKRRPPVKKYHDRVAGRYDRTYDDAFWKWHDDLTWDHLKAFLPADLNAEVLDLGCGTGKWGVRLLKSGYRVTFVDISHQMIDQARLKAHEMGSDSRSRFLQADLSDLSALPRGGFELALALGEPIGCTASPPKTLKQIRRCLTPGGVLVATFDNKFAALDFYLSRGDSQEMRRFIRDGKTHWLTRDADEQFPIVTVSPSGLIKKVETAGFTVLDMIGKTVLPMRHYRGLLETSESRRRWAKLEKLMWRDPAAIGRAAHLQIACRVKPDK